MADFPEAVGPVIKKGCMSRMRAVALPEPGTNANAKPLAAEFFYIITADSEARQFGRFTHVHLLP
jgi:hypothetical protein